jgi:hypothetical protein
MARNVKQIKTTRSQTSKSVIGVVDPDSLKGIVRDGLVGMNLAEREEFIRALESEMRTVSLNMRSYLIPLGIPARTLEELTPTEVGHLVRFLRINVPQAMPAVEHTLARFDAFADKLGSNGDRLAA